jgi:hypothetical protein
VDPRYLGMGGQIFGDETSISIRPRHADLERFERAHQHPTRIGIQWRANGAAPAHHLLHEAGVAADTAANEIAVAAGILGQRTQRDVSAAFQWRLEHRAQHRIVDHDRWSIASAPSARTTTTQTERLSEPFHWPIGLPRRLAHAGWLACGRLSPARGCVASRLEMNSIRNVGHSALPIDLGRPHQAGVTRFDGAQQRSAEKTPARYGAEILVTSI